MMEPVAVPMESARLLRKSSRNAPEMGCFWTVMTSAPSFLRPLANMVMTCGMAKRPMSAAMMLMPPPRLGWKMKRCAPMMSSKPMVASHSPMQPESRPLTTDLLSSEPMTVTPRMASQNRWLGPKASAHWAKTGVRKISSNTPKTPPTAEARKLICSALAPSPFWAIVWPSSVVAMLAGAPGIFSKMAETAPPATVDV